MSQYYGSESVGCPFYNNETKNTVKCEGAFSVFTVFVFGSALQKKKHKQKYCNWDYIHCPNYQKVNEKYFKKNL